MELNILEIFNEMSILMCTYSLVVFSNFEYNKENKTMAGHSIIFFTVLNICVNIGIMLFKTYKKIRLALPKILEKTGLLKYLRLKFAKKTPKYDSTNLHSEVKEEPPPKGFIGKVYKTLTTHGVMNNNVNNVNYNDT